MAPANPTPQTYVVTERAGPRVAGRVVEKGQELELLPAEAEHELREGTIVPKGKELAKGFVGPSKRADRMRREAEDFRERKPASPPAVALPTTSAPKPAAAGQKPAAEGGSADPKKPA